jgi:hypothetical protein
MEFRSGDVVQLTESAATTAQQTGLPFALDGGGMTRAESGGSFDVIGIGGSDYTVRSIVSGREGQLASSVLYSNRDMNPVVKDFASDGRGILQSTHYHEVGHLLGLSHVDVGKPHCPSGSNLNARPCYGIADVTKNSVMGGGIRLTNEHALPWRRAITQLTGCGNLSASSDWAPARLKIFPRTIAEANAGRTITTRPVR